jgi:hypothetical protein
VRHFIQEFAYIWSDRAGFHALPDTFLHYLLEVISVRLFDCFYDHDFGPSPFGLVFSVVRIHTASVRSRKRQWLWVGTT